MKNTLTLNCEPRTASGHNTTALRLTGVVPAVIYGSGISSTNLSVDAKVFDEIYDQAGETHVVMLQLEGKSLPVLVKKVQRHPVTRVVLHIEFLKVNLKEKMKTVVPVSIIGESPAVKEGLGTLLTIVQEVEIEALPTNIPESLSVDISSLSEVGSELKVSDLDIPSDVVLLSDPNETLVKIGALTLEKEEVKTEDSSESTENANPEEKQQTEQKDSPKTE